MMVALVWPIHFYTITSVRTHLISAINSGDFGI